MTSIIGIPTNSGEEGVVLASDTQVDINTTNDELNESDRKGSLFKIVVTDYYAIASTGTWDRYLLNLFSYLEGKRDFPAFLKFAVAEKNPAELLSPLYIAYNIPKGSKRKLSALLAKRESQSEFEKALLDLLSKPAPETRTELETTILNFLGRIKETASPLEEAIKIEYLHELGMMNRFRYSLSTNREANSTNLVIAVNKPRVCLYKTDDYGTFFSPNKDEDIIHISAGTGEDIIESYFTDEKYNEDIKEIKPDEINLEVAVRLAVCSLKVAIAKDPKSGGTIDIAVVTKNKVEHYGPEIKSIIEESADREYNRIIEKYKCKAE